ncbi:hypothetical protein AAL_06335 [Moelleriella libera RCEF 2490]|uniref:Uncharacterized protein n=1 Tax=Moelleriella libera RCEF 2490 TaxID=1081109 RepID=A0A167Z3R3_9HYPO|nr:hypothetical protein AAL_06335 [Moelleriella libera RCEF 2490]
MAKSTPQPYVLRTTPQSLAKAKFGLRIVSVAFCAALIGIGVKLLPLWGATVFTLTPACSTMLWDIGLIITSLLWYGRDVRPGARVGIDLFIWLAFGAMAILMAFMWGIWGYAMGDLQYNMFLFTLVKVSVFVASVQV